MAKKDLTPDERRQIAALLREIKQDVRELRERLEARRGEKR